MCQMLRPCPDMTLAVERGVKQQLTLLYMILIFYFQTLQVMASNHAPLTATEKHQLRTQPNVDLILAWAMVRGIDLGHPEVLEQMRMKAQEVSKNSI